MIYVFAITIVYTLIKQRNKLLSKKRNLVLYLFLSAIGMALGVVYLFNPYLPSLSLLLEKYTK
jgi:multisubunit Na+/H+ antiporter MnhB subunit